MLFPFFPLQVFFGGGAGMPAILMWTEPKWLRLVKKQRLQVVTAEADVGRCRLAMDDATELLSRGIENIDSTRTAAIHVSGRVNLHAVRAARLRTSEIREQPVALLRQGAVGGKVERADMAAAEIIDIDHTFIGREGEPVGKDHIVEEERDRAEIRRDTINAGVGEVPLLRGERARPRIGKINRAVRLDDDIVWPVEAPALEAIGDHRYRAVMLLTRDAAGLVLAGQQPTL